MFRKLSLLTALGALAIAFPSGNVGAQTAKPTPSGCFGALITDDAGDSAPYGANLDITGGWFRYTTGKDGKPQLVADIKVATLDKSVTPGWNAHTWWVRFTVGEVTQFVIGQLNSDGSWAYHSGADAEGGYSIDGSTTGRVFEGADGIIEIDVKQKVAGKTLGAPHITGRPAMTQGGQPILTPSADRAPDSGGGEDWDANPCGASSTPSPSPISQPATLDVKTGKAKRSGKGVSIALSGQASNLTSRLMKGKKTVAKGKLAKLAGKATLKVKGSKKIAKGAYKLSITGTTSSGSSASKTFSLKLK